MRWTTRRCGGDSRPATCCSARRRRCWRASRCSISAFRTLTRVYEDHLAARLVTLFSETVGHVGPDRRPGRRPAGHRPGDHVRAAGTHPPAEDRRAVQRRGDGRRAGGRRDARRRSHALAAYAKNLGLAFQIIDDLLDVEGDPVETGKTLRARREEDDVRVLQRRARRARARAASCASTADRALEPFGHRADRLRELSAFVASREPLTACRARAGRRCAAREAEVARLPRRGRRPLRARAGPRRAHAVAASRRDPACASACSRACCWACRAPSSSASASPASSPASATRSSSPPCSRVVLGAAVSLLSLARHPAGRASCPLARARRDESRVTRPRLALAAGAIVGAVCLAYLTFCGERWTRPRASGRGG